MLGNGVSLPEGCVFASAAPLGDRVEATYRCGPQAEQFPLSLQIPERTEGVSARTREFSLVAAQGHPALVEAIRLRIVEREAAWHWKEPDRDERNSLPQRAYLAVLGRFRGFDALFTVVFLALSLPLFVRYRWSREEGKRLALVGLASLLPRLLVGFLPANFYSDLYSPSGGFRYNTEYTNVFYDTLSIVWAYPEAVFVGNVLVGTLVPIILYLALSGRPVDVVDPQESTREKPFPALTFSLLVALLPLFVRLSASDAPHTYGMFLFALGTFHFTQALTRSRWENYLGFTLSVYLLGATRRELATGALVWLPLLLTYRHISWTSKLRAVALLGLGIALGLWFTRLYALGTLNGEVEYTGRNFLRYLRAFPEVLLLLDRSVPWLLRLGVVAAVVLAFRRKNYLVLPLYAGMIFLVTIQYATGNEFSAAVARPLSDQAIARYAAVWYLGVVGFAAYGVEEVFSPRWKLPLGIDRGIVLSVLWLNAVPAYAVRLPAQQEYAFLRTTLKNDSTGLPIVVGWQKWAGEDLVDALAMPYAPLVRQQPQREWIVVSADSTDRVLDSLPTEFLYFSNVLSEVPPSAEDRIGPEARNALASFRFLRCVLTDSATVIAKSEPIDRPVLQLRGSPSVARVVLYRVRRPVDGWVARNKCAQGPSGVLRR